MKHLLITITAVVLTGCCTEPKPPTAKASEIPVPPAASMPLTEIELPTEMEKSALINKTITVFGIKIFA